MSLLRSTPVLCLSSFILGIAIVIQCELLVSRCGVVAYFAKVMLQITSRYHHSTSPFEEPHSIGGHITNKHNLCTDVTNETISCELMAINTLVELAVPSYSDMMRHQPESFVTKMRALQSESMHQR